MNFIKFMKIKQKNRKNTENTAKQKTSFPKESQEVQTYPIPH